MTNFCDAEAPYSTFAPEMHIPLERDNCHKRRRRGGSALISFAGASNFSIQFLMTVGFEIQITKGICQLLSLPLPHAGRARASKVSSPTQISVFDRACFAEGLSSVRTRAAFRERKRSVVTVTWLRFLLPTLLLSRHCASPTMH